VGRSVPSGKSVSHRPGRRASRGPSTASSDAPSTAGDDSVRVWLVERTEGDDELNVVILTYATPDGERDDRTERALTSGTGPARETTAAVDVAPTDL
jgi:hypothetical protein